MAFYNNTEDENENVQGMNSQNSQQQNGTTAPTQLSNGVQGSGSAPIQTGSQPQTSSTAPKSSSSGMTGFQNYQKANQGTATNKLAGAATSNVSNQGNQAKTSINQATTSFGQKVDSGSLANRENAVTDVKSAVDAARNVTAPPKAATPTPNATTSIFGVGTVKAGLAQPVTETPAASTATAPATGVSDAQKSRFQEVINAKYQGPESLRQSGEYNKAAEKVSNAQTAIDQAQSAQGREALLRNMYSQGGNYTQGLNKLDAGILNASGAGVNQLQNVAKAQGNIQGQLDQAQINSANLAQNRAQEITNIRNQSRDAFTQGKTAEEAATEARLQSVVDNWNKLPDYFKNLVKNGGQSNLNSLEAGILGVGSGEGLYNLGSNAIATGVADKQKLISRDEQARQAALASLGGLDSQGLLSTDLKYGNADLAGTQTALDALDLAGTRANLNTAEKNFQDFAEDATLTGYGSKKNKSSGKRYYAEESANIADLLKNAGYQFGETGNQNNIGNTNILRSLANVSDRNDLSPDLKGLEGSVDGAITPVMNQGDGQSLASNYADYLGTATGLNYLTGALGLGSLSQAIPKVAENDVVQAAIDYNPALAAGNIVTNALGLGNVSSALGSVFGQGSSSKESKNIAAAGAREDLQTKVQDALASQGYQNRINVTNDATTNARVSALQQLLAGLDKTNA